MQEAKGIFVCVDGIIAEQVGDYLYLCNPQKREVFVLNPYAAAVWQALSHPSKSSAVIDTLRAQFSDPQSLIESDVTLLLGDFESRGLIETGVETASAQDVAK